MLAALSPAHPNCVQQMKSEGAPTVAHTVSDQKLSFVSLDFSHRPV